MVLTNVIHLVAADAAFAAAIYWFRSGRVKLPSHESDPVGTYEPGFHNAIVEMAGLSQRAAIWAGIAAILGVASILVSVRT